VHNRITTLLHAMSKNGGEYPDSELLKQKGPVEPSGLMIMDPNWRITFMHKPTVDNEAIQ
jgi:hypothetical protein